jgi:hypothetical protein
MSPLSVKLTGVRLRVFRQSTLPLRSLGSGLDINAIVKEDIDPNSLPVLKQHTITDNNFGSQTSCLLNLNTSRYPASNSSVIYAPWHGKLVHSPRSWYITQHVHQTKHFEVRPRPFPGAVRCHATQQQVNM